MIVLLLALVTLVVVIWLKTLPSRRHREMANKIPGPRSYPIVGNIFNFEVLGPKSPENWKKCMEKYGNTFRVWLGPQLNIFIAEPDDLQMILSSQTLTTKAEFYKVLESWLGTGLLISKGELWHRRRKAITPTFHFKILEEFIPIFRKCTNTLVDCLKDKLGQKSFNVTEYMSNCALDVITETAMGTQLKAQTNPQSEYPTAIFKMTKVLMEKIGNPLLGVEPFYTITGRKKKESDLLKILFKLPHEVITKKKNTEIINNRTTEHEVYGQKKRTAFLDFLLKMQQENAPAFQRDQDIKDEVITFIFEGHDTTTMALTWTTWLLGRHLKIQEKLYEEVSSILSEKEEPLMEDYQKMSYLDRVLKESLRLYPSVPIIGRLATEDLVLPSSGYVVPAGALLVMNLYALHRREDLFQDANKFDPDRFLEPRKHPYSYLPFSAGSRNCIGQKFAMLEMKVTISNLILNYKIKAEQDTMVNPDMLLRSCNGPDISIIKRN